MAEAASTQDVYYLWIESVQTGRGIFRTLYYIAVPKQIRKQCTEIRALWGKMVSMIDYISISNACKRDELYHPLRLYEYTLTRNMTPKLTRNNYHSSQCVLVRSCTHCVSKSRWSRGSLSHLLFWSYSWVSTFWSRLLLLLSDEVVHYYVRLYHLPSTKNSSNTV